MKAINSSEIISLYDWFPGYGENSYSCFFNDLELKIEISYDSEDGDDEKRIVIVFKGVVFHSISSYPGVNMSNVNNEKPKNLGSVIEFLDSDASKLWSNHFKLTNKQTRHFQLILLSTNKLIEVIASEVIVL